MCWSAGEDENRFSKQKIKSYRIKPADLIDQMQQLILHLRLCKYQSLGASESQTDPTDLPHLEEGGAGEQTVTAGLVLRPYPLQL